MRYTRVVALIFFLLVSAVFLAGCLPPVADASLQFYNDSSGDFVRGIFLQREGDDAWGENLITGEINPGCSTIITDLYPGVYSIKVRHLNPWDVELSRIYHDLTLVSRDAVGFHFTGSDA